MRLIPGKTKVKIELFRKVTLSDVAVGLVGLVAVTLCVVSSLPGRWIIAMIVAAIFALMLFRIEEEPMYVFMWHMLRYKAYPRRYSRVFSDKLLSKAGYENAVDEMFNEEDAGKTDNSDIIEEAAKEQAAEAVQAVEEEAVEAVSDEAAETVETVEAVAEEAAAEAEEAVSGKKSKKRTRRRARKLRRQLRQRLQKLSRRHRHQIHRQIPNQLFSMR